MYVDPGINTSASNLKWVLPYCKPDLPRVVGALLLTIPILSGIIVDRVIVGGHADELPRLCGLMILMTIIRVGARYGYQMWMERFGQNSVYRLVSDEYEKLHELDFTYFNAVYTVENALAKAKDEKGLKRVVRFLKEGPCADCGGTRLSVAARAPHVRGLNLAEAGAMTLDAAADWVRGVPESLPADMRPMAANICESFLDVARRLLDLGLGYLALDRAGATLSTGERQRVQLARAVRNRTIGVLYVLDEPSIGLHPSNVDGLLGVMHDLVADSNSVVVVDHDVRVLKACDHLIEMGPVAGAEGGHVIAQGTVGDVAANPRSRIAPFLADGESVRERGCMPVSHMFDLGHIRMTTSQLHTVKPLDVDIPRGRLVAVTGVSGSGKTTMVLESLIPALKARSEGEKPPEHVRSIDADGIERANLIDATPIGANVRSTVATYADIHDDLRRAFARSDEAKAGGWKAGDFSYNTGRLRCPTCDGTGSISLDVQFLPDVDIECPDCRGSRYAPEADAIHRTTKDGRELTLPQLMAMSVDQALAVTGDMRKVHARLTTLHDLGLGYLTLGEPTPALSGGEAQRLKLASEMGRAQSHAVFVFDEPTIGLHPLDAARRVRPTRGVRRDRPGHRTRPRRDRQRRLGDRHGAGRRRKRRAHRRRRHAGADRGRCEQRHGPVPEVTVSVGDPHGGHARLRGMPRE